MTAELDNDFGMKPALRRIGRNRHCRDGLGTPVRRGTDTAEVENGDHEWDNDSVAVCHSGGHAATVKDFDIDNQSDALATNEARAERARTALLQYVEAKSEVFEESSSEICDLIADLLHLAVRIDQGDDPVESTLRLARLHFDAEHENPEETGEVAP